MLFCSWWSSFTARIPLNSHRIPILSAAVAAREAERTLSLGLLTPPPAVLRGLSVACQPPLAAADASCSVRDRAWDSCPHTLRLRSRLLGVLDRGQPRRVKPCADVLNDTVRVQSAKSWRGKLCRADALGSWWVEAKDRKGGAAPRRLKQLKRCLVFF